MIYPSCRALRVGVSCQTSTASKVASGKESFAEPVCGLTVGFGRGLGEGLQDGRIHLFAPATGAIRSLDPTLGATALTWSPKDRRIAYTNVGHELRVIDIDTGHQDVLASGFDAIHGIGPVWSPDGETIVYQRVCATNPARPGSSCREQHEVVLVRPDDPTDGTGVVREVVIPAPQRTSDGSELYLFPYRVTWSPDGAYLLYMAWTEGDEPGGLVAVPIREGNAIVLARFDRMVAYEGYPDTAFVPIQSWGRRPSD